jgi:hypothetical protein
VMVGSSPLEELDLRHSGLSHNVECRTMPHGVF